jgi:Zn-dependent protease
MNMNSVLFTVSVWTLPILLAVTLHEAAHGWAAWKLGDDTAKRMGRVTFNPLRHIDLFGTIILPALLLFASGGRMMFGFAKPVPVDFSRLNRLRRDMILVALAGPATNLLIAFVAAGLFHGLTIFSGSLQQWLGYNLANTVWINVLLFIFNMLPLPPLDGGRVAVGLLPPSLGYRLARLERVGIMIILIALFVLPWIGGKLGLDLNVFGWLVGGPAEYVSSVVYAITGVM